MKTHLKLGVALTVAATLSGCATKPPTAKEEVSVWLAESPRVIAVETQPKLPEPRVHTRDHQGEKRAGQAAAGGLKGAGYTIYAGCRAIPLIGCIVGLYLAPVGAAVGAVVGAVAVDSTDVYHAADAVDGAETLFEVARRSDLPALLAQSVTAQHPKAGGHQLRIGGGPADSRGAGSLHIALQSLDLSGDTGADAAVALRIGVHAEISTPTTTAALKERYTYAGSRLGVAEWAANDARLFREEIATAIRTIATEIAQDIHSSPSRSAVSKVQAARESGK
jgi:hypothetical protein